jgi:DNA-directed RNA polymerase specialized sigma24 family protein
MESARKRTFLDARGKPLSPAIQKVLGEIWPRFRARFPLLDDDVLVTEILEEAGQRLSEPERQSTAVRNLSAYAWTTVLNVTRSRLRRSSMRLAQSTLDSEKSEVVIGRLQSSSGTVEQIEADILLQELFAELSEEEQALCIRKHLIGFSSRQIARAQGKSIAQVNTEFYRLKQRMRELLRGSASSGHSPVHRRTKKRKA